MGDAKQGNIQIVLVTVAFCPASWCNRCPLTEHVMDQEQELPNAPFANRIVRTLEANFHTSKLKCPATAILSLKHKSWMIFVVVIVENPRSAQSDYSSSPTVTVKESAQRV